jgi:predicted amidophosphoribosyltransferase
VQSAAEKLLDLILPQRCVACDAVGAQLCEGCAERLPRIRGPLCARCGAPAEWPVERCRECSGRRLAFASARAAVEYDRAVRALVRAWKEQGLRRLVDVAAAVVLETVERPDVQALTYVPPDWDRRLKRGHHPPERLARELAQAWDLPLLSLLEHTRRIEHQRDLPRAERRKNVAGAFRAPKRVPARVALVDDVYTSGATANAAASALRAAGARRVDVVTLARAIRTG